MNVTINGESTRSSTPLGSARESSARALLLVLLGEFVWPAVKPVWSSTLLAAMADLEVEPNAARKALQRTAASGVMTSEREGRRVRWQITPDGYRLLAAGDERVFGWEARDTTWDGRWLILSVSVPETQRRLRHHLQTRLTWAGLGSPTPGQWLTTHADRAEEVAEIITDLGFEDQASVFIGVPGPLTNEQRLVDAAWNLEELAADYRGFIDTFSAMSPRTDLDCMRSRVALTQAWRKFPYLDPDLPKAFLPDSWPGHEAARLFRERRHSWEVRSVRHWNRLEASA